VLDGEVCDWPLFNEPLINPSSVELVEASATPTRPIRRCVQGHEMSEGDLICFVCGSSPAEDSIDSTYESEREYIGQSIDNWLIEEQISEQSEAEDYFSLSMPDENRKGFFILYKENYEPDPAIYRVMERMDHDHLPDLISTGRWRNRPYEIHEWINYGSLREIEFAGPDNPARLNEIILEIAKALRDFAEVGLRHRDINPKTILARETDPLDLVITDFGSARLSDFDLDVVSPLTLTRYSAPEAIVGAISAASDWWSLGMIVLEQVTNGECFKGVNEKAFLIHVVTRGVEIPPDLDIHVATLLKGHLSKDPLERWQWDEVHRWLNGDHVEPPSTSTYVQTEIGLGTPIILGEASYTSPERFALSAAEAENWDIAL